MLKTEVLKHSFDTRLLIVVRTTARLEHSLYQFEEIYDVRLVKK